MGRPAELKVYTRDYSGLDSPGRGAGKFHASRVENGADNGVAACNENILLVREEPWQFLKVPEAELCRSAACKKVFGQQVRGRKTGKSDRRDGVPGSDRRAARRRLDDALKLRVASRAGERERERFIRSLRGWPTTTLVVGIAEEVRDQITEQWRFRAIAAELDARIPPREP